MFIPKKTTSPHQGNLRAERIRSSGAKCLVEISGATLAPRSNVDLGKLSLEIMKQRNCVPEMSLS